MNIGDQVDTPDGLGRIIRFVHDPQRTNQHHVTRIVWVYVQTKGKPYPRPYLPQNVKEVTK